MPCFEAQASLFGDLIGKLGVLRMECVKRGRAAGYRLAQLIERHGRNEKLSTWLDEITALVRARPCPFRSA